MKRPWSTLRLILQPLVIAIGLALLVRHSIFRIYAIPSASMAPTLQNGDHILVTPYYRFGAPPLPGDVVVFRSPSSADELLVKRIIGAPGDLVNAGGGNAQIVPAGHYFVMGDNRSNSSDSRTWGPLPAGLVVGRARMVLWSSMPESLRMTRVFHPIE